MKRVLVIEDNEDNMKLITFILEKNGYATIGAESGEKGVALALREAFDFIVLDIQLPGMDGLSVLKRIRRMQNQKSIPIIAMTSHAMAGDKEALLNAGCTDYIEKPIDPANVISRIRKAIGEVS